MYSYLFFKYLQFSYFTYELPVDTVDSLLRSCQTQKHLNGSWNVDTNLQRIQKLSKIMPQFTKV